MDHWEARRAPVSAFGTQVCRRHVSQSPSSQRIAAPNTRTPTINCLEARLRPQVTLGDGSYSVISSNIRSHKCPLNRPLPGDSCNPPRTDALSPCTQTVRADHSNLRCSDPDHLIPTAALHIDPDLSNSADILSREFEFRRLSGADRITIWRCHVTQTLTASCLNAH